MAFFIDGRAKLSVDSKSSLDTEVCFGSLADGGRGWSRALFLSLLVGPLPVNVKKGLDLGYDRYLG